MSTIEKDLATELEEGERLRSLELENEIAADISAVLEKRHEVALRYAILTCFDDGDPETGGQPWAVDHAFADTANDSRIRFCDAVVAHLRRG